MCQNEVRKKETTVKISNAIVGVSLSVVACSAAALSLGSSRGTVVLGAPVDLSFEVIPDAGSDVASSCVSARLVSGADPVAESKVQITPVEGGRTPMVRVRAFISVDEPVLTATLTAGCSGQTTRTYTFLADLPTAAAGANRPVDIARLAPGVASAAIGNSSRSATAEAAPAGRTTGRSSAVAGERAPAAPRPARADSGTATAQAQVQAPRQPRATSSASPRSGAPAAAGSAKAAAPLAEPKARLVMEPLELWLDSPLALRPAEQLAAASTPVTDAQRAEAAALWKAMNASPEEVRDAVGQASKLQADVAAQRARANTEGAAAADLRQRLETVQAQSFPAMVVYGLLALLLLALALVVWIWSRARRSVVQAWEQSVAVSAGDYDQGAVITAGPDGRDSLHTAPQPADAWNSPSRGASLASAAPPPVPRPAAAVMPASRNTAPAALAAAAPLPVAVPTREYAPVAPMTPAPSAAVFQAPKQIVHPEELFDIQQQAEFFVSVGEHDQAIGVLKKHIADHGSTSPYAYLELLRLYHTLSRAESFSQLRAQFQQHFNAHVPEFSSFHRMGRTLEDYPDALAAIEAQWPTTEVMEIIEGFIVRKPGASQAVAPFDMAAYDDLLLLLAIAQTTPASQRGAPPPRARTTPLAPVSQAEYGASAAPASASAISATPQDMPSPVAVTATAAAAAAAAAVDWPEHEPAVPSLPSASSSPAESFAPSAPQASDLDMMPFEDDVFMLPPMRPITGKPLGAPSLDSLMGGLSLESLPGSLAERPLSDAMLDLDLSDPPPLTTSDLPPVPVTAPPSPDQPVGFGMSNDKLEVRLELQEMKKRNPLDE